MGGCRQWLWIGLVIAAGSAVRAQTGETAAVTAPGAADTNSTVITSTQLSFDQEKRVVLFEDHVMVKDPELSITTDRLKVVFSEDYKVVRIEAEGRVSIEQKTLKATSAQAIYNVVEGKIELSGNPQLQRSKDTLTGDKITFWRNTNRVVCEPNAWLIIHSDQDLREGRSPLNKEP